MSLDCHILETTTINNKMYTKCVIYQRARDERMAIEKRVAWIYKEPSRFGTFSGFIKVYKNPKKKEKLLFKGNCTVINNLSITKNGSNTVIITDMQNCYDKEVLEYFVQKWRREYKRAQRLLEDLDIPLIGVYDQDNINSSYLVWRREEDVIKSEG